MPKTIKEFQLNQSTGEVSVEYSDDSTSKFNASDMVTAQTDTVTGVVSFSSSGKTVFESVSVRAFGAVGDGVADDSASFIAAVNSGRRVYVPAGIYRITQPVTASTSTNIVIEGESPAYLTHDGASGLIADTGSAAYTDLPYHDLGKRHSVILCDGCNFVGTPDTASVMGASSSVRSIKNLVLWGTNGAKCAIYTKGSDLSIESVTAVLFERFGFVSRGQITSSYYRVATIDCGWNLVSSGTATYPNTYVSGCGLAFLSNYTAQDYTTVDPAHRPTTITVDQFFAWTRAHTGVNKSGLRGIHAHGLVQFSFSNFGGYTGNFFNICMGGMLDGYYVENYALGGLVAGDATPYCNVFVNCNLTYAEGYLYRSTGNGQDTYVIDSNQPGIPCRITQKTYGAYGPIGGPTTPTLSKLITVGTAGSTQNYTFPNFLRKEQGFIGFLAVSLIKTSDFRDCTRAFFAVESHRAGAVNGWQSMTPYQITQQSSVSGAYAATISVSFSSLDLIVSINWGASWPAATSFQIDLAAFGASNRSS